MSSEGLRELPALVLCLALCFAAAALGGSFTASGLNEWYDSLKKPFFNPPSWVFGPVWTMLYAMMAASLWLVWKQRSSQQVTYAIALFLVHLLLNVAWSAIFFGMGKPGWAFVEILFLWASIVALIIVFKPIDRPASLLLWPYLAWVSFATVLNGSLWYLNKG